VTPPAVVVLVEGASDAAVVRVLYEARGLGAMPPEVELRDMGGVTNVGRHLRALDGTTSVLGLCDAPEERFVVRGLRSAGHPVGSRDDLEQIGFWVCDRDLEDELIRALGPDRVEAVLDELAELDRFRAFQRQPQWRGRPVGDQLRRFAGTASGRKLTLARRLAEELAPRTTPPPLASLVDAIADRAAR
jgi:hypothetical protein